MSKLNYNSTMSRVKDRIDLSEHILKHEKELDQVSHGYQGSCSKVLGSCTKPAENNKSSMCFSINADEGYFNCFSCDAGGDIIAYEADRLSVSRTEALLSLCREYNIEPDYEDETESERKQRIENEKKSKDVRDVLSGFEKFTKAKLGDVHKDYLISRGFTEQSIADFGIGYCPSEADIFISRYDTGVLVSSGLFTDKGFPVLANRIVFPLKRGKQPYHFVGRIFNGSDNEPKYIGSRSTKKNGANTSAVSRDFLTFGKLNAKMKDEKTLKPILLLEGCVDGFLAEQELSDDYVIAACLGVNATKEQMQEFATMLVSSRCTLRDIIVCFDSESHNVGWTRAKKTIIELTGIIRELLIREQGRIEKKSDKDIEAEIKDPETKPNFMPKFKMTMLRKPPEFDKIDLSEYVERGLIEELRYWIENSITVSYYEMYLINDPERFFGLEDGTKMRTFYEKRVADEIQWEGRYYIYHNEQLRRYEKGVYLDDDKRLLRLVDNKIGEKSATSLIKRVSDYIETTTKHLFEGYEIDKNLTDVNVLNGYIPFSKPSGSEIIPHSPFRVSFVQIPHRYNPDAECPKIERFFVDVLAEKDVVELMKGAAYTLTRDISQQKVFLMYGGGGNGKGVAMGIIQALIGDENFSAKDIARILEGRFSIAGLEHKLANFDADIKSIYLNDESVIKKFAGKDYIEAEHKGKDEFKFKPVTSLWFSSNFFIKSNDRSYGASRKWHYFGFDKKFTDTKFEDKNLVDKLTTEDELEGLLKLCWEYYNLLDVQGFVLTERSEQIKDESLKSSDFLRVFTDACFVESEGSNVLTEPAYFLFKEYVHVYGKKTITMTQKDFNDSVIRNSEGKIEKKTSGKDYGNRTSFRNIAVNVNTLNELEAHLEREPNEDDYYGDKIEIHDDSEASE